MKNLINITVGASSILPNQKPKLHISEFSSIFGGIIYKNTLQIGLKNQKFYFAFKLVNRSMVNPYGSICFQPWVMVLVSDAAKVISDFPSANNDYLCQELFHKFCEFYTE